MLSFNKLEEATQYYSTEEVDIKMQTDRGLQACIGVVLAFSLLWTIAIMIPDDRGRSVVRVRRSNTNQLSVDNSNKQLNNINENLYGGSQASSSRNLSLANHQVSSDQATQQSSFGATNQSSSSAVSNNNNSSNISSSSTTTSEKKRAPLFPRWAWFGMFIVFHAQRFIKKVRKRHYLSSSQPYTGEGFYHHKSGSLDDQKFLYDTSGLNSYYGGLEYEDDTMNSTYGATSQTNWSGDAMDKFDMEDILSQSSDDLLNTSLDDSDLDDLLEL